MLRPGVNRYSLTVGQFRDQDIDLNPWVVQGKYQQGINNYLTGYTGIQATENYAAVLLGAAFATPIGAVALDVTHSEADFEKQSSQSGQSFRLSYSKLISPTNTNLTLAAYRYSTENFYKLRDALLIRDLEEKGVNTYAAAGHQRSEFQITLNQGLPEGWGNFYVVGSWVDYWNRSESTKQYQIGYSNNYHGLTYGLSAINRKVEYGSNDATHDTEYLMTLSFPINFKRIQSTSTLLLLKTAVLLAQVGWLVIALVMVPLFHIKTMQIQHLTLMDVIVRTMQLLAALIVLLILTNKQWLA